MKINIGKYPKKEGKDRKINIKIHDYDVWSLDHTLAMIIHPCLIRLKEKKHGAPNVEDSDVPDNLKRSAAKSVENDWDTDEYWHQRWNYVLKEMIWAFENIVNEWKNESKNMSIKERNEIEDRISNGLKLFGKYYRNLWD